MWSDANSREAEPQLEIDEIQGDVLIGLQKDFEWFIFFKIGDDVEKFKNFARKSLIPKITSAAEALQWQIALEARATAGQTHTLPIVGLGLGFTRAGLDVLGVPGKISDTAFDAGMASRSQEIDDPQEEQFTPRNWRIGGPDNTADGVILITGPTQAIVDRVKEELARNIPANENRINRDQTQDENANGWRVIYAERGMTRPKHRGREHFGFKDGISQPRIRGRVDQKFPDRKFLQPDEGSNKSGQPSQGSDLLWPGEFVFGYPSSAAPDSGQPDGPGELATGRVPWARNGSLMVLRRFQQDVPEFSRFIEREARSRSDPDPERLAAEVMGRWKSGAPLSLAPVQDDWLLGADPERNNAFDFASDREGRRCPLTAHIRQMYPRSDELSTYSHRLIRRGIPFGPELTSEEKASGRTTPEVERGLMLVCYQTSIQRQFEELARRMNAAGPAQFLRFIHLTGGGYFFMPSISTCKNLIEQRPNRTGGPESIPPLTVDQSDWRHVFLRLRDLFNAGYYESMRPFLHANITWKMIHHSDSFADTDGVVQWLKTGKTPLKPQFLPKLNQSTDTVLTGDGSVLISGPADWKANNVEQNIESIKYYLTFTKQNSRWFLSNAFAIPLAADHGVEDAPHRQIRELLQELEGLFNQRKYRDMRRLLDPKITWKMIHHADSIRGADLVIKWLEDNKDSLKPQFNRLDQQLARNSDGSCRLSGTAEWQAQNGSPIEKIEYHFTFVSRGDAWLLNNAFAVVITGAGN